MFGLIKSMFIGLLISIVNKSNHAKCVLLSNQKCENQSILLIDILMNTVKNFITTHLLLN